MSDLHAYWEVQRQIRELEAKLERIAATESYQKDKELHDRLLDLVQHHGKSLDDVVLVLTGGLPKVGPEQASTVQNTSKVKGKGPAARNAQRPRRYRRPARVYRNPYTGETIKTRNPRNRALRQWMVEYGPDVVASWGRIETDAQ